jgi:dolichol-phosphate mannosyltransferase
MNHAAISGRHEQTAASVTTSPELSVVVPTFNERKNVRVLVERLGQVLQGTAWEVIFVDDNSPDGTASEVKAIGAHDPRVRCIRRVGRRGLAGACIEGMLSSQAPFVAVMDGDLQHDENLLSDMLRHLQSGQHDIVIGSRNLPGADAAGLSERRQLASRAASLLASRSVDRDVTDPLSGFFMLRRDTVDAIAPRLSTQGFKILLDILISTRGTLRVLELPFHFRGRNDGVSKMDATVVLDFVGLLVSKATGNLVPQRFAGFALVGTSGIVVHLTVLKIALVGPGLAFEYAQALATIIAMVSNFFLNNELTYRDQRLRGFSLIKGLLWFCGVCSIGALSNLGVADWLYDMEPVWWLAGLLGSFVGAVWNYAMSSILVWRRR